MTDRRVERTLDTLHRALIGLILAKGYDAITVNDIVAAANVGRSTFYTHYSGKEELLEAGLKALHKSLRQRTAGRAGSADAQQPFGFSLALFEHAAGYQEMFRALVGKRAGAVVLERMRALLSDLVRQEMLSKPGSTAMADVPEGARIQHVVGSLMSMLSWWLDEEKTWTPAQVNSFFYRLALHGVGCT